MNTAVASLPTHTDPKAPTIAAIVVSFNRLDQLKTTVDRLLSEPIDHVLVVDNCSTDGTNAWLSTVSNKRLHVIRNSENLGGAAGFELAMRFADTQFSPDWFLLMDDDARPQVGAIAAFRSVESSDLYAVAAAVFQTDGKICEMNRPWRNPLSSLALFLKTLFAGGRGAFRIADENYTNAKPTKIDGASFVGLFLSKATVQKVGFPDGRLFIYGDDVIYTLSCSQAGYPLDFRPDIRFEHDCDRSVRSGPMSPMWKNYYRFRNGFHVYRKLGGPVLGMVLYFLFSIKWFSWCFTYTQERRDGLMTMLWLAWKDALSGKFDRDHSQIVQSCRN